MPAPRRVIRGIVLWIFARRGCNPFRRRAFFKANNQNLINHQKNQTIMKNLEEYDRITQTIEIPSEVVNNVRTGESAVRFRKYIYTELAHKLAEKLMESGYITETWLKKEHSEECTATLYVKPLIKNN